MDSWSDQHQEGGLLNLVAYPNCRELTVLTRNYRHERLTCDRANVGEIGCTRQGQSEVGAVGEKDDDDGVCWEK